MSGDVDRRRALLACDKFKGSLRAMEACEAVARGLGDDWVVEMCPLADGGEGFVDTMIAAMSGELLLARVRDALGREVEASYGLVQRGSQRVAVIEMASASGMWRMVGGERDVMASDTYGTGQLIRHAIEVSRVDEILVGLGGSATNDGGAGMAAALGVKFFDENGRVLSPCPRELQHVARVDVSQRMPLPPIQVACDVDNPLCGPKGASAVYGPQKGASAEQVVLLDACLGRLAEISGASECALVPGAGAAGGLGFGFMAYADAKLMSGFSLVAEIADWRNRVAEVDLVITGEGSLDEQSLHGKGPVGMARLCGELGVPCVAVAGRCTGELELRRVFDDVVDLRSSVASAEESMARAAELIEQRVLEKRGDWRKLVEVVRGKKQEKREKC
jgi:glycerate kinase